MPENNEMTQEKLEEFNAELKPILKKYGFALGAEATIVDGKIVAKAVVSPAKVVAQTEEASVDTKNAEKKEEKSK